MTSSAELVTNHFARLDNTEDCAANMRMHHAFRAIHHLAQSAIIALNVKNIRTVDVYLAIIPQPMQTTLVREYRSMKTIVRGSVLLDTIW